MQRKIGLATKRDFAIVRTVDATLSRRGHLFANESTRRLEIVFPFVSGMNHVVKRYVAVIFVYLLSGSAFA